MCCKADASVWLEITKLVIPALIVTVGWFISHYLTSKRDRKVEIRKRAVDRCDALINEVAKTRDISLKYHVSERSVPVELELVSRFADLSLALPQLTALGAEVDSVSKCSAIFLKFKQAITLVHFEDGHTGVLKADDEQLFEIARCASSTLRCLRECQSLILRS